MPKAALQILLALMAILATTSCERRDLWVYRGGYATLYLKVDWTGFEEEVPTGMTAIFYSHDPAQKPITVISPDIDGCYVNLPRGIYDVVLFNQIESEYSNEEFRGMQTFQTAEVALLPLLEQPARNTALYGPHHAPEQLPSLVETERDEVYEQPEPMAVDTLRGLIVSEDQLERTSLIHYEDRDRYHGRIVADTVFMFPRSIVWTMRVNVHVNGIDNYRAVRGSIRGLAEGFLLGQYRQNAISVFHQLDEWSSTRTRGLEGEDGLLQISTQTFGMMSLPRFNDDDVVLNLQVLLRDQQTIKEYHFDIANKIERYPEQRLLVVDTYPPIDLPEVEDRTPSAFDVDVEDWEEEEVTIFMSRRRNLGSH